MNEKNGKRLKGVRAVATLQTHLNGVQPRERHHAVSRFARLENERVRLERELGMWAARKSVTEEKLAAINEQIAALKPLLLEERAEDAGNGRECDGPRGRTRADAAGASGPVSHAMLLEY